MGSYMKQYMKQQKDIEDSKVIKAVAEAKVAHFEGDFWG